MLTVPLPSEEDERDLPPEPLPLEYPLKQVERTEFLGWVGDSTSVDEAVVGENEEGASRLWVSSGWGRALASVSRTAG